MKKIKLVLLSIISIFMFNISVNASSAIVNVKVSSSKIVVGNTLTVTVTVSSASPLGSWEYSLNYDKNLMTFVSSSYPLHYAGVANNGNTKSVSYSYKFKAAKSGTAKFYISSSDAIDWNESSMDTVNKQAVVTIITKEQFQESLSKDNNLKELKVDGYDITPEFKSDVLEYSLTVPNDVKSINVSATKNDNKASVNGTGEQELTEGLNKINVVVTAENGNKKTYVINVTVKELNPITITYNNETYTVIRDLEGLPIQNGYQESTVMINGEEVKSLHNDEVNYTLIGLKSSDGTSKLYLFNESDGSVEEYKTILSDSLNIRLLDTNKTVNKYKKYTEKINDEDTKVLKLKENSRYSLIYGINIETGEKSFYMYDKSDGTIQKYNDEEIKVYKELAFSYLFVIIGCSLLIILLFIMLLITMKQKKTIITKKKKIMEKEKRTNK